MVMPWSRQQGFLLMERFSSNPPNSVGGRQGGARWTVHTQVQPQTFYLAADNSGNVFSWECMPSRKKSENTKVTHLKIGPEIHEFSPLPPKLNSFGDVVKHIFFSTIVYHYNRFFPPLYFQIRQEMVQKESGFFERATFHKDEKSLW